MVKMHNVNLKLVNVSFYFLLSRQGSKMLILMIGKFPLAKIFLLAVLFPNFLTGFFVALILEGFNESAFFH